MKSSFLKSPVKISRISTLIILLALIRTLAEPLRLYAYDNNLSFGGIRPFLFAALLCATGLFAMIIFSYYKKYRAITFSAVLIIIGMLLIKLLYL